MSERVAIVVPAYQAAGFIAETLESVVAQTHADWECRVVDDGSTDGTADAVRPFLADPRMSFERQANQGVSAARNRALAQCTGDYVTFLDADDIMKPPRLARCLASMRDRPDLDLLVHRVTYLDARGRPLRSIWNTPFSRAWQARDEKGLETHPLQTLILGRSFPPCAALLRMEAMRAAGLFDPALHGTEDSDLWIRLAARGARFGCLPYVGAGYRRHPGGANLDIEKVETHQLRLIEKTFGQTLRGRLLAAREPVARAVLDLKLARKLYRAGRRDEHEDRVKRACRQLAALELDSLERTEIARMAVMIPGTADLLKTIGAGPLYRYGNLAAGLLKNRRND